MRKAQSGFTLAELLIALALLGVIAAFTIPKVLQATGQQEGTAKVREAVSTLEQTWYNQKLQSQVVNGVGKKLYDNVASQMNTLAADPAGTDTGCGAAYVGTVKFHNGVVIAGLANGPDIPTNLATQSNNYLICIDTNASATQHNAGQNLFYGNFNSSGGFNGAGASADVKNFNWGPVIYKLNSTTAYATTDPEYTAAAITRLQ